MSSGFPGGHHHHHPDYFNTTTTGGAGRSISIMNLNNNQQPSYRSTLAGILAADPSSQIGLRRPDLIGKRSLAEFQHQQQQQLQLQQQAAFFLRNVKQRPYNNNNNNNHLLMDFSNSPEVSSVSNISSSSSSLSSVPRYGVPVLQQIRPPSVQQAFNNGNFYNRSNFISPRISLPNNLSAKQSPSPAALPAVVIEETEGKMMKRLQELEKQLLLDDDEEELDGENDVVSGVTNSEWSETIQNILGTNSVTTTPVNNNKTVFTSSSPTSSTSSSSCASSSASPATTVCPKKLLNDAASAITDGKTDSATEILTRVNQVANARGTPEQRLSFYMAAALRSRLNGNQTTSFASELYGKEHILSTQLLYDKSPCFKLAFMAANNTILQLVKSDENDNDNNKKKLLHVVDFDIGQGVQYVYLLHEIAAATATAAPPAPPSISLKLTTFTDFGNGGAERLNLVGDNLKSVSNKLGVSFSFNIASLKLPDLTPSALMAEDSGEILVVNLAFKLYKLPDESVTTENLRDEVLRRVKGLSPALVTVIEQELNGNTASFEMRVSQACGYYGALLESLDATIGRDTSERVRVEEGLSRRMVNSVACEGRDRVERCEVFGKWRARMRMAGFESAALNHQLSAESLLLKLNSVSTRGNPGFTVKEEEAGGIGLGWMGRTLTVASAWH